MESFQQCISFLFLLFTEKAEVTEAAENKTIFVITVSVNKIMILCLTEFPFMLAISFNFLNTPPAVKLAGWNIILWLLRELSATRPKSPFSWASALILSNCRPRNKSKLVSSSNGDG